MKGEDVDCIFVWGGGVGKMWILFLFGGGGEGTDVPTSLTSHT